MDKPRGIKFNPNAVNIQNTEVRTTNSLQPERLISLKQAFLTSNVNNKKVITTNENDQPVPNGLQQFEEGKKRRDSPKEPSPPKLKYNNTKLLTITSSEPLIQPLTSPKPALAQLEPLQSLHQQQQEQKQEPGFRLPETVVSRIPKLAAWLPNASIKPFSSTTTANTSSSSSISTTLATKTSIKHSTPTEPQDDEEVEDIDKSTSRDAIFFLCDIAKDIFDYMFTLEEAQAVKEDYLKDQKIFTPKVRQRLVNWCLDINTRLELHTETAYITVALIDRYFDQVQVKHQSEVQLVAMGATLIASKYEEIYPPEITDLIKLAGEDYTKREVMRIEIQILEQLNFDLGKPIPLAFLRRFSKAARCDIKMHSIAKFLMELSLTEYECSHWQPSMLAAAALFATIYMVNNRTQDLLSGSRRTARPSNTPRARWDKALTHYTRYNKEQLQEPAGILCKILKRSQKSPQSFNCVKKFAKFFPQWPELKSARIDELIKFGEQQKQRQ